MSAGHTSGLAQLKADTVAALITSLASEPAAWRWTCGNHLVIRHTSGTELWVTLSSRVHIYRPSKVEFGFWQGRRLRRAFKRWKREVGNAQAAAAEAQTCNRVLATLRARGDTPKGETK